MWTRINNQTPYGEHADALKMETTEGRQLINQRQLTTLAGCGDYQMFWDRR